MNQLDIRTDPGYDGGTSFAGHSALATDGYHLTAPDFVAEEAVAFELDLDGESQ